MRHDSQEKVKTLQKSLEQAKLKGEMRKYVGSREREIDKEAYGKNNGNYVK
jgi:hypothetical protein